MPTWGKLNKYDDTNNYQMCSDWDKQGILNIPDVNSCKNNAPANTKGWQACGIGSSPGGLESGHTAQACSAMTPNFSCMFGQNCFAIIPAPAPPPAPTTTTSTTPTTTTSTTPTTTTSTTSTTSTSSSSADNSMMIFGIVGAISSIIISIILYFVLNKKS